MFYHAIKIVCLPYPRHQDAVDSTKFYINLKTEIRECLWGRTNHILEFYTYYIIIIIIYK